MRLTKPALVAAISTLMVNAYCLPEKAAANDFWETIEYSVTPADAAGEPSTVEATINGAKAKTQWNDINQNSELDGNEILDGSVNLFSRDNRRVPALTSPANMTRAELEDWAEAHADEIAEIIFPSGLTEITGETDDSIISLSSMRNILIKATPNRGIPDYRARLEYHDVENFDEDGQALGMILSGFTEETETWDFSMLVPYRYTDMDDEIDSESHFLAIDMKMDYKIKDNADWTLKAGGNLFGSIFYFESDALEYAGQLKYGAGLFGSATRYLPIGTLSAGLSYKIAKAYLPSGLVDDDSDEFVDEAIDYINDLDAVGTVSYGLNYGLPLLDNKAAVNFEIIRQHFISSDIDSDRDTQTSFGAEASWYPSETFEINAGIRTLEEMDDLDDLGIMLGCIKYF
ncbi:MAG: hypothetical protein ACQES8_04760 [Thermodesulfobacteriota bacterium]